MMEPMSIEQYDLWIDFAALGCAAIGTMICLAAHQATRRKSRDRHHDEGPLGSPDHPATRGDTEPVMRPTAASTHYTLRHSPMGFSAGPHAPGAPH